MAGLDTTRNRSMVLAQFLRNAARDLRQTSAAVDAGDTEAYDNALESIDAIAAELEAVASTPDPASGLSGITKSPHSPEGLA